MGHAYCRAASPSPKFHLDYSPTIRGTSRRYSTGLDMPYRKTGQQSKRIQQASNPEGISLKRRLQIEGLRRAESKRKYDAATSVVCALEERRHMQLSNVIQMAESAVEKGNDVIDNLVAQREVIRKWKSDLEYSEELVDDVKGIMTVSGKVKNMVSKTSGPEVSFLEKPRKRTRRSSLPDLLPSYFSTRRHSEHYLLGVKKLSNVLDSLHKQHRDLHGELQDQEKYLAECSSDMDRLKGSIFQQSTIIKRKMNS